jgi:multidrug efflux system outer membrane protein
VRQGILDSRNELTASEAVLDQRDALLQLDSSALSADIALQRALGGGYQERRTAANPAAVNPAAVNPTTATSTAANSTSATFTAP